MRAMSRLVTASFALAAALAFAPDASAKAYYAPLVEVEDWVDAVAILETGVVADVDIEGEHWRYRQLADARVVEAVAGDVGPRVEILGARDFVCAPVHWDPNTRYLALLLHEGGRWTAANNEWGRLEIVGGVVDWPYDDTEDLVPVEQITTMLASRLEGRLGRGRIVETPREPVPTSPPRIEPDASDRPPLAATDVEADPAASPAPWIALGAVAVALGFVVGMRRRR